MSNHTIKAKNKSMSRHSMSVFTKETDLIKSIIDIHLDGKDIDADFTFFKGNSIRRNK